MKRNSKIIKFAKTYGGDRVRDETFFESACIADLMTTCFCGRGRMLAKAFVKHDGKVGWRELEKEILGGQQIPDWHNAQMVYKFLKGRGSTDSFPFFCAVYRIGFENADPSLILEVLKT